MGRERASVLPKVCQTMKLNDNEVQEVARMQSKIDCYELFIKSLFLITKFNSHINYPVWAENELERKMNYIWRWVNEHK